MMQALHISDWVWAQPYFLGLLIPWLAAVYFYYKQNKAKHIAALGVSNISTQKSATTPWQVKVQAIATITNWLALLLIIIALGRPQLKNMVESLNGQGIDIVLSIDISGSMLADDFEPNRLEAAKQVASNFVQNRKYDRMGLVIFSGESFSQCPITTDHSILLHHLASLRSGVLQDGTAIGMGLATAVDRLRDSKLKSKVVILLTDGVNNTGLIDPNTALAIAKTYNIKVYTIGMGTNGTANIPVGKNAFGEWILSNPKPK
jgi:Ca-activated chloride channel homolog